MPEIWVSVKRRTSPAVLLLAVACWVSVVVISRDMAPMTGTMGLGLVGFVAVWVLMMAAMMLPSVAPFASVYARTFGERHAARTAAFVCGYLMIWIAAALPVYGIARAADQLIPAHPAGATVLAVLAFASCGIYQLTSLKDRCLAWCRSPLGFAMKHSAYRGRTRDFRVGMHHGAFCLACCWALMALLLAFGIMNLIAMTILALIVFVERSQTWGPRLGRLVGVGALVFAVGVIFQPALAPGLHQSQHPTMTMDMR